MIDLYAQDQREASSLSRCREQLKGKEWRVVPWSELPDNMDVYEGTGEVRTGLFVFNNPINYIDPNGLWGVQVGNFNLGIGDPSLHFNSQSLWDVSEAAQAAFDGIVPFADPFANNGGYDPCDSSLRFSQNAAAFSRDVYSGRLLLGGAARLGASRLAGTRWINSNRYLRLGQSGHPPQLTLRIGQARPPSPWNHIPIE